MTTLPKYMTGIILEGYGDYDKLQYKTDILLPKIYDDDVLVKVSATGVNNTDVNTRIGWYAKDKNNLVGWNSISLSFPRIQGADVCGKIVAVGKNVDKNMIGKRVIIEPCLYEYKGEKLENPYYFGSECDGGFAQYTSVNFKYAHIINSNLSDEELATFACSYSTAENLLTKTNVKKNETILITGASGGVGSACVQLAKARGAKVLAVTSKGKSDEIKSIGADKVILRDENILKILGQNSVDVVIDLVAGEHWARLLEVLKPKGRYGVSGAIGGAMVNLDIRTLYLKDLSFFGCTRLKKNVFKNLIKHIEDGNIKPLVAKIFDLKDIVKAQEFFLQKKHIGKIVLKVQE